MSAFTRFLINRSWIFVMSKWTKPGPSHWWMISCVTFCEKCKLWAELLGKYWKVPTGLIILTWAVSVVMLVYIKPLKIAGFPLSFGHVERQMLELFHSWLQTRSLWMENNPSCRANMSRARRLEVSAGSDRSCFWTQVCWQQWSGCGQGYCFSPVTFQLFLPFWPEHDSMQHCQSSAAHPAWLPLRAKIRFQFTLHFYVTCHPDTKHEKCLLESGCGFLCRFLHVSSQFKGDVSSVQTGFNFNLTAAEGSTNMWGLPVSDGSSKRLFFFFNDSPHVLYI